MNTSYNSSTVALVGPAAAACATAEVQEALAAAVVASLLEPAVEAEEQPWAERSPPASLLGEGRLQA